MPESTAQNFNHLKIHSQYSICEGAVKIDDLQDFSKSKKIKSLGLCDTSNLCGALEFAEKISKVGTQPIIGTQINFKHGDCTGLLPLFALNEEGYKRIIKLSSISYLENDELSEPHIDFKELLEDNSGVAVFSGTIFGLFGELFNKGKFSEILELYKNLKSNFVDRFYLEIQRHGDQNELGFEKFNLSKSLELEIPLIATNEVFYLDKDMHEAHDALICIGNKTYVNEKSRIRLSKQHYFKDNFEMTELFADLPEALENNYNFPLRCNFRPLFSNPILPNISSDKDGNADDLLTKYSSEGLRDKFLKVFNLKDSEIENDKNFTLYKERLDHELSIIIKMKYSSYFLIVSDYIKWAKENDIPVGPGRGSGAGSLVAWCLSITDVDPIKFNLIFERFLNPDRVSMPDFDIDFCKSRRDEVIEYVQKKYGYQNVAQIITFGTMKSRSILKDIGRVEGIPYSEVDRMVNKIPYNPVHPLSISELKANHSDQLGDLAESEMLNKAESMEGALRNASTHAAGIIISSENLYGNVTLFKNDDSEIMATQFNMKDCEKAGLLKFDFLGLANLTIIDETLKLIKHLQQTF